MLETQVVDQACGENWALYLGDSAEVLCHLPARSVDLSVYSPPFASLYTYSASERDLGNSATDEDFFGHYGFITAELSRIVKPGRLLCVHCMDLPLTKATHGVIGLRDFSGALIAHHVQAGHIFHGRITIDRDPQGVACRNKTQTLMFATLHRDQAALAPVYPQYILLFRIPGENAVPIRDESVSNEDWIAWARTIWYDIRDTDTLNVAAARDDPDERHVCPLALPIIDRCVRLYSNKGEVVLSPFAGIGSELYGAILAGRRAMGVELKRSYFKTAVANLQAAEAKAHTPTLFDILEEESATPG
jgi:hypothetical protein